MAQEQTLFNLDAPILRDTDPNVLQNRASNPLESVWVGASAGTGKTKVLTDRVLRLLLPRSEDSPGSPPHKILCLTFTKAGAGEMALRISSTLAHWAVLPEGREEDDEKTSLRAALKRLLGRPAAPYEIAAARRLFASVVDHPGGLPIMTIHAYCQSLLGRFPLEAGLKPGFEVLEEAPAARLLEQARAAVLERARLNPALPEGAALHRIGAAVDEKGFFNLLADIRGERRQFTKVLQENFGVDGLYTALCKALDVVPGREAEDIRRVACADDAFDSAALAEAARLLGQGKNKTDAPRAIRLSAWLQASPEERFQGLEEHLDWFLTERDGRLESRAKLLPVAISQAAPQAEEALRAEAARLERLAEEVNRSESALLTRNLFILAAAVQEAYAALKTRQGALDFDDLILSTLALLKGGQRPELQDTMPGWVQYKLDQGLDHLLVDEAQDTNPEQWEILETLTGEFFAGQGARVESLGPRTVFVVGDHKQSIYSFQRASPREFARMKEFFSRRHEEAERALKSVDMNTSFRSGKAVLDLVDAVFADQAVREGLGEDWLDHRSHRRGQAGRVDIWPLSETPKKDKIDYWALPPPGMAEAEEDSGPAQLAARIAQTIRNWLDEGEILPARGRAIRPGDIMILVKNRRRAAPILQALKNKGIPVGGADRVVLNEELAVQDVLAAASFALLPGDDLTLACLLKSPLIGLSEEELFTLAHGRAGNLWEAIPEGPLRAYLQVLIESGRAMGPYAFLNGILNRPCLLRGLSGWAAMQARLGRHVIEPLEALLESAMNFERQNLPSLQLFLDWQRRQEGDIKREMSGGGDEAQPGFVRLMTVHGSKGLQAPVVILPDTIRAAKSSGGQNARRLLWPHQSGFELPLWSLRKQTDFPLYTQGLQHLEAEEDREYRRLLYVALTRAEDRLYIGGASGRGSGLPDSWYHYVRRGFERLDGEKVLEDGTLRFEEMQSEPPDRLPKAAPETMGPAPAMPGWLSRPAPAEPSPARPLAPSRPSLEGPAARSPLESGGEQGFIRGTLTHRLLQFLPDLALERREGLGRAYLQTYGAIFAETVREEILAETLSVLNNPDFAALFAPGSQAEVAVSGFAPDGTLISGQIDRLVVSAAEILIADYKTGRRPPADPRDIPPAYLAQMRAYAGVIRAIYPGRPVRCALVWTDGAVLMPVPLDEAA